MEYEVGEGRATITLADPARRNPLSVETMEGLVSATRGAVEDPSVRVLVFTGAGDQAFSAGGTCPALSSTILWVCTRPEGRLPNSSGSCSEAGNRRWPGSTGMRWRGASGLPSRDITVCVDDARLGVPEIGLGLWPM